MNGGQIGSATSAQTGRLLKAVLKFPGSTPAERVEALYFAVLSRPPRPAELEQTLAFVKAGESTDKAFGDVLWVLLNGIEFRTNH